MRVLPVTRIFNERPFVKMKFPKHRANCFVVMRYVQGTDATAVGVFPTSEGADHFAGACAQEWLEKGFNEDEYLFQVHLVTYYDA